MKKIIYALLLSAYFLCSGIAISDQEAQAIGKKIWKNECNGTKAGLTTWRVGEDFASLGIGHFIWYPAHTKVVYKETFPSLLHFMKKKGKHLPKIVQTANFDCPWKDRTDFYNHFHSPEMVELRVFLCETVALQVEFIIKRVEKALTGMLNACKSHQERTIVHNQFYRVAGSPNGWYALIDYINFKGEGIKPSESYNGHAWGLLQVLLLMHGSEPGKEALQEFAEAAKKVLALRVENAAATKKAQEQQWLLGWNNRIDTYIKF